MDYLKIKDWDSFQHYRDRRPPWIKLQTDTFQDYEFGRLQDASKLLAICIWTLASRYGNATDGIIPHDLPFIKRQCNLGDTIKESHLNELINKGFLIASNPLASCYQLATPETETEAEAEAETYTKKTKAKKSEKIILPDWINENDWNDFLQMRKKIRKPATERAQSLIINKLEKMHNSGSDANAILNQSTMNCWQDVFELKTDNHLRGNNYAGSNQSKPTAQAVLDKIRKERGWTVD